jgi:hypothetical protein
LEYELLDTGVFDQDQYFDVFVEYAKATPEELLIKITLWNRGPEAAALHILPTLWFRNTWSWSEDAKKPILQSAEGMEGVRVVKASHPELGERFFYCEGDPPILFTENETNNQCLFGTPNSTPYVKDGINNYVVNQQNSAVNPESVGTKMSAHYQLMVVPGKCEVIRLRLNDTGPKEGKESVSVALPERAPFGEHFEEVVKTRLRESDEFYASIIPPNLSDGRTQCNAPVTGWYVVVQAVLLLRS